MHWMYHPVDKLDKVQRYVGRCGAVSDWRGVGPRTHDLGHFIYTVFGPRRMSNSGDVLGVKEKRLLAGREMSGFGVSDRKNR